jgi:hypothetical protein
VGDLASLAGLADDPTASAQDPADQVVVNRARRQQHWNRRDVGRHAAVRQDHDVDAVTDRRLGLGAEPLQGGAQALAAFGRLEQAGQRATAEARLADLA